MNQLLRRMHFRVPSGFSFLVKPDARIQVFCVASVKAVSFTLDDVDIVGHLSLAPQVETVFFFKLDMCNGGIEIKIYKKKGTV